MDLVVAAVVVKFDFDQVHVGGFFEDFREAGVAAIVLAEAGIDSADVSVILSTGEPDARKPLVWFG